MQTYFKADWKLAKGIKDYSIATGTTKRSDLSESVFIAGGSSKVSENNEKVEKQVQRIFLSNKDTTNIQKGFSVLGTDMTTGLKFIS